MRVKKILIKMCVRVCVCLVYYIQHLCKWYCSWSESYPNLMIHGTLQNGNRQKDKSIFQTVYQANTQSWWVFKSCLEHTEKDLSLWYNKLVCHFATLRRFLLATTPCQLIRIVYRFISSSLLIYYIFHFTGITFNLGWYMLKQN